MSNCNIDNIYGTGELCTETPFSTAKTIILAVPGTTFANGTEFADESVWLTKVANGELFPIKNIFNHNDADGEGGVQTSATGMNLDTFRAQRGADYEVLTSLKQQEILMSYSSRKWEYYAVDDQGIARATLKGDGTIKGLSLFRFFVHSLKTPSAEVRSLSRISIQESDYTEGDMNYIYVQPAWNIKDIGTTEKVSVTFGAVTANAFTATVKDVRRHRVSSIGAQISSDISGLTADNFYIVNESGTLLVPDTGFTATEQAGNPGVYDIDATVGTLVTGVGKVQATSTNLYSSPDEAIPTV